MKIQFFLRVLILFCIFLLSCAQEWLYPQKPAKKISKSEGMAQSAASIVARATSKIRKNAATAMVEVVTMREKMPKPGVSRTI